MQPSREPTVRDERQRDTPERPLEALLAELALDAREEPEAYLAETLVPAGGE